MAQVTNTAFAVTLALVDMLKKGKGKQKNLFELYDNIRNLTEKIKNIKPIDIKFYENQKETFIKNTIIDSYCYNYFSLDRNLNKKKFKDSINQIIYFFFDEINNFNYILEKLKNYHINKKLLIKDLVMLYENFKLFSENIKLIISIITKKYKQKIINKYKELFSKNNKDDILYFDHDNRCYLFDNSFYDDDDDDDDEYDDYDYYLEKKHLGLKKITKIFEDLKKQKHLEEEKKLKKLHEIEESFYYLFAFFNFHDILKKL